MEGDLPLICKLERKRYRLELLTSKLYSSSTSGSPTFLLMPPYGPNRMFAFNGMLVNTPSPCFEDCAINKPLGTVFLALSGVPDFTEVSRITRIGPQ